jgi:hypothetical protein
MVGKLGPFDIGLVDANAGNDDEQQFGAAVDVGQSLRPKVRTKTNAAASPGDRAKREEN